MPSNGVHTIVIVDDNPGDTDLLILAFESRHVPVKFMMIGSGPEAYYHVRTLVETNSTDLPSLIVLDLNMPEFNGFQLLGYIRTQPLLRQLKVVMFSATSRQRDRDRAMELGASAYLDKPSDWDSYSQLVDRLCLAIGLAPSDYPVVGPATVPRIQSAGDAGS